MSDSAERMTLHCWVEVCIANDNSLLNLECFPRSLLSVSFGSDGDIFSEKEIERGMAGVWDFREAFFSSCTACSGHFVSLNNSGITGTKSKSSSLSSWLCPGDSSLQMRFDCGRAQEFCTLCVFHCNQQKCPVELHRPMPLLNSQVCTHASHHTNASDS